jgi:glycerophosphoryl diester phosphodiesterase
MRKLPRLFLVSIFAVSCTNKTMVTPQRPGDFTRYKNVVYGTDTLEQSMDVYIPTTTVAVPAVILLHGGAWSAGSKQDFDPLGLDTLFTSAGIAVVNMNYSLVFRHPFPAAVDDIKLAIDYLAYKASEWHIDPNRICILGKSSGAHLALLYAYSRHDKRVKAVIDCQGPTDLTDNTITNGILNVNVTAMLGPYSSNTALWQSASPLTYLDDAVPTVIIQGSADSTVFPIQSIRLRDSLQARGIANMYIEWTGSGHGWNAAKWNDCKGAVLNWIEQYL